MCDHEDCIFCSPKTENFLPQWMLTMPDVACILIECRGRVCDKPWDDDSGLHDRLSDLLGLPRSYPSHERLYEEVCSREDGLDHINSHRDHSGDQLDFLIEQLIAKAVENGWCEDE